MKQTIKYITMLIFIFGLSIAYAFQSEAATIIPASGDKTGKTDYLNMKAGLENDGDIVLESGKTYYMKATLYVKSNQSITATGATIISKSGAFRNKPNKTNYKSIVNFKVDGGVWKNISKTGYKTSMVQFSHGSNIEIKNATIYCNYSGHSIEFVACKNVMVDHCVLKPLGSYKSTCVEEQLQIDIATPITAPTVASYGKKYVKGQTCQNITVQNCNITGGRGVCANYASKEKKYQSKFHKNIILKNNNITGMSSEGVALFNVLGAKVENNKITSKSKRTGTAYSVGLHIAMFGKAPSKMKSTSYIVNKNLIKGGRQGFYVYSHSSSKFGKVSAKANKCYAKSSKNSAILVAPKCVNKIFLSKNKIYKWK